MSAAWVPETAQTAETSEQALALARAWADGRRSWINLGSPHEGGPYAPDVLAAMDAQEVVKWSALAVAFAQVDAAEVQREAAIRNADV